MLPRRAAIPAVNLTSVFSTSAFVPARSTTRCPRASHFICLILPILGRSTYLRFHRAETGRGDDIAWPITVFPLTLTGLHVIDFVFRMSRALRSPFWKTDSFERLKMQIVLSHQVRDDFDKN